MMHTQHFEVNENVSRAMHTEYKTGKQNASFRTFKILFFLGLTERSRRSVS